MYRRSISAFRDWLDAADPAAARQWLTRMNSSEDAQLEGAIAEAVAWDYLACRVKPVRLGKLNDGSGPDFVFGCGDQEFAVEVTNISGAVATAACGLPDPPDRQARAYCSMNAQVKAEVDDKASQLSASKRVNVVFVTTLHFSASRACFHRHFVSALLHAEPKISWQIRVDADEVVRPPHATVDFEYGLFTKANSIVEARKHISCVLVGGFGLVPPDACVRGVLHPAPVRPFDPAWLLDIEFCRFCEWPPGDAVRTEWVNQAERA